MWFPVLLLAAAGLKEAVQNLEAGRLEDAERQLVQIVKEDPRSADAHFFLGMARFRLGRMNEAIEPFESAVRLAPRRAAAHRALGTVHAAMGNYNVAEAPLTRACELDPRDPDACYYLGRTLYALNRFEGSLDALAIALKTGEKPGRIHQGMGQAHEALGNREAAELHLRKGVDLGWPEARTVYGVFLFRQGRLDEARIMLEQAVKTQPNSAQARMELGRTLLQRNRLEEALPHLQRAVELDGSSAAAHLLLGKVYQRLGRIAEAERHLDQGSRTAK
jgi:tetratricopeptide (TPR) repeat protein